MPSVRSRGKTAKATQATNRYDAGGSGRRIARWNPPTTGPQRAVAPGFEKLRNRVHDAVRNDWAAESSTQKWVTNLIGTGIQPRFKNKAHRAIWDSFGKQSDADGVLDIYGQQVLMARSLFDGGEVFLRRRPRALTSPLDVPLQIQIIESEFCPMFDADVWPGLPEGNTIRQGIERNKYGARTAYWFYREHPNDAMATPGRDQLVRVAASEVAHVYEVKRPGLLRGVSPLANILVRLRSAGDLEDAVLDRQKLANLFALFITRQIPNMDDVEINPLTGLPNFYDSDGASTVSLEPGIAHELRPGESATFAQPPGAGVGYSEFQRANGLGTAAGQGLPYELMSGDIKDVSDRSMRIVINEFRRYCQQRQWITLIPQGCQRMLDWCMNAAALADLLTLAELPEAKAPTWTPQGWDYIHPVQDAQGKQILKDMGAISLSQIITERGDDPEKVFDERQADAAAEKARGLEPPPAPAAAGQGGQGGQQKQQPKALTAEDVVALFKQHAPVAQAAPNSAAVDAALAAVVQVMAAVQAQNVALGQALQTIAQSLADRPLNVEAPKVDVHNEIQPTPAPIVNVTNEIPAGPAPIVNVTNEIPAGPAPIVNVTNDVQPAEVKVDVNLPARETTSVIDRDRDGNITNVVQTERTLN